MYSKQVHRKKRKNYRNAFSNSDSTQKRYIDPEIEFYKTQRLALIAFTVGLYVGLCVGGLIDKAKTER